MRYFVLIITSLIVVSCSKKTTSKLIENSPIEAVPEKDMNKLLEEKSYLVINYGLNKQGIIDTFQYNIDEYFNDTLSFPDYNLFVSLKRASPINVEFDDRKVLIELPLDIKINKNTFFGDVKADGELLLSLISEINVDAYWQFSTKTQVANYSWTRKPKLKIGVSLPIETISNKIIEKIKPQIVSGIDDNMRSSLNLKAKIQNMANMTMVPYKLNEVYGGYMTTIVDTAYMTGAINKQFSTEGKIMLAAKTYVSSHMPNVDPIAKTPVFAWGENIRDTSTLQLQLDLTYDFLETIANENVKGKVFSEGDKKITISDIKISNDQGSMVVNARVYGTFNGIVQIKGIPYFDASQKMLKATNIDVSVNTSNLLHSAAAWLMKGKIKSELSKMMEFSLGEKINDIQSQVDQFIDKYGKDYNMDINAKIGSVDINNIIVEDTRIRSSIVVNCYLHTYLKNLSFFR